MIRITETHRAALINARGDYDPKAAKKAVFRQIRQDLGIPDDVRMKVEIDNTTDPLYMVVKNADTGVPLTHVTLAPEDLIPQAPTPAPVAASRFATTETPTDGVVYQITVDDLLRVLRGRVDYEDATDYIEPVQPPAGLPAIGPSGIVLDTQERVIYFRR